MNPIEKLEIANLSEAFHIRLLKYLGEVNDQLTWSNIREETLIYLRKVQQIAPIQFDSSKIGLCPASSTANDLNFNPYTVGVFQNIRDILSTSNEPIKRKAGA